MSGYGKLAGARQTSGWRADRSLLVVHVSTRNREKEKAGTAWVSTILVGS